MIRTLRGLGSAVLWLAAVLGVLCGLVWGATRLGYIQPLVVISGSMEPGIMTGDLIVDREHPTAEVQVGEVASIHSEATGKIITHRITDIAQTGSEQWSVRMQGDANTAPDGEDYVVGATLWQPALRVPAVGHLVATMAQPSVAIPLGIALFSCVMLALLPRDEDEVPDEVVPVEAVPAEDIATTSEARI